MGDLIVVDCIVYISYCEREKILSRVRFSGKRAFYCHISGFSKTITLAILYKEIETEWLSILEEP